MKIIQITITVLLLISSLTYVTAQTKAKRAAFGFNINQIHNDFGIEINIFSPYFAGSKVAFKIGQILSGLNISMNPK